MNRNIHEAVGRFLAMRSRSEGEMRMYLDCKRTQYQLDDERIEALITKYKDLGLINDANCVEAVVHSALSKGKGNAFVRQKLIFARVDKDLIARAFGDTQPDDIALAMGKRLARYKKRWEGLEERMKKQKAYQVLASSGFLSKDISPFIDVWVQKE